MEKITQASAFPEHLSFWNQTLLGKPFEDTELFIPPITDNVVLIKQNISPVSESEEKSTNNFYVS